MWSSCNAPHRATRRQGKDGRGTPGKHSRRRQKRRVCLRGPLRGRRPRVMPQGPATGGSLPKRLPPAGKAVGGGCTAAGGPLGRAEGFGRTGCHPPRPPPPLLTSLGGSCAPSSNWQLGPAGGGGVRWEGAGVHAPSKPPTESTDEGPPHRSCQCTNLTPVCPSRITRLRCTPAWRAGLGRAIEGPEHDGVPLGCPVVTCSALGPNSLRAGPTARPALARGGWYAD